MNLSPEGANGSWDVLSLILDGLIQHFLELASPRGAEGALRGWIRFQFEPFHPLSRWKSPGLDR